VAGGSTELWEVGGIDDVFVAGGGWAGLGGDGAGGAESRIPCPLHRSVRARLVWLFIMV
jgi:hypothetical protein